LDSSNQEKYYLRNKIRLDLIPTLESYNSNIKNSLVSTSGLLADDEDYIEKKVEMAMAQVEFDVKDDNFASLDVNLFNSQHPALQKRLIRQAILVAKGDLRSISVRHVLKIIQMMELENAIKEIHLPGFLTAVCDKGKLFVRKRHNCDLVEDKFFSGDFESKGINVPGTTEIGFRGLCLNTKLVSKKDIDFYSTNSNKAYFDYDKTGSDIKVRVFRPGDRFVPLGMKGTKKLKAFFIDEKIPRDQRKSIPLITSINDDIIWVYEKRIGERYRVTDKSTRVMVVEGIMA
jgi:tRNA(Ile)-lysidine synthase